MTQSTLPRRIISPAALSTIRVNGMPSALQLPGRQARALEQRPRLVDEDVDALSLLVRRANDGQRRAVAGGGEGAGVAVGEDGRAGGDEVGAKAAYGPARFDLLLMDALRLRAAQPPPSPRVLSTRGPPPSRGPAPTPGSPPSAGSSGAAPPPLRISANRPAASVDELRCGCQSQAVGRGHAERRRAANAQLADRLRQRRAVVDLDVRLVGRQARLIEEADCSRVPAYDIQLRRFGNQWASKKLLVV